MSSLGWVHTTFAVLALLFGAAVLYMKKGTRGHRTVGHFYLTSMLTLNISSFFITDLFGGFGPFHWMAAGSLLSLIAGMVPLFTRRPTGRWLALHGGFITGSYVGLVAAAVAEVAARNPQTGEFVGAGAAIATVVVIAIGTLLISRYLPGAMRATPSRFQRNS